MNKDSKSTGKKSLEQLAELDEVDFGIVTGGKVARSQATLLMQYDILAPKNDEPLPAPTPEPESPPAPDQPPRRRLGLLRRWARRLRRR